MIQALYEWLADDELTRLIRRYYGGEAGLWHEICAIIDTALRQRGIQAGTYHIRLLRVEIGYMVRIYEADEYANTDSGG